MDSDSKPVQERTVEQPNLRTLNHANTALLLEALSTLTMPAVEGWHTFLEVIDTGTGEVSSVKILY